MGSSFKAAVALSLTAVASPAFYTEANTSVSTIAAARELLDRRLRGEAVSSVGAISLGGFDYYRELDLGHGTRALAISGSVKSGFLSFDSDGRLTGTSEADELISLLLCDLDGDGVSEVITEETTGKGTGVLIQSYRLYAVVRGELKRQWSEESYFRGSSSAGKVLRRRAFLRVEFPEGEDGGVLVYLQQSGATSPPREKRFRLRSGRVESIEDRTSPR